jgi:hypothetical protein
MSEDLVKRLRELEQWIRKPDVPALTLSCDLFDEAADRIEQLEAALRSIAEGDILRTVKIPFRDDGQSSKHDRCEHGQWFYEDCGCCIEDYARKALEGKDG